MRRYVHLIGYLFISLSLVISLTSCGQKTLSSHLTESALVTKQKKIVLGEHNLSISEIKAERGITGLKIDLDNYDYYYFSLLETMRYQIPKDPLGPRPDWGVIGEKKLKSWADYPDLISGNLFTMTIYPDSLDDWSRIQLLNSITREYLIRFILPDFFQANAELLKKANKEFEEKLGKPVHYIDLKNSSLEKRNQYYFYDAIRALSEKALIFLPNPDFDTVFAGGVDPTENFPHVLPKALNVTTPINQHALVVVHASRDFDDLTAKDGIDNIVAKFKQVQLPIIYLMHYDGKDDLNWYTNDKKPTAIVYSAGGEHNLPIRHNEVTIVGGYFGDYDSAHGCHFKAVADTITRYYLSGTSPLRIHLPISAIFFFNDDIELRNNFLQSKISPTEFIDSVHSGFFFTEDENLFGMSQIYTGDISTSDYQFLYYVDGALIKKYGNGPRIVEFSFEKAI